MISQSNGRFVPPPGPSHSDKHPRLDYIAQRAFFARHKAERWKLFIEVLSPRSTTVLAEYLKIRPLTVNDYRMFSHAFMDDQLPQLEIFRSLLLRWQREAPTANEPIEIAAQTPDLKSAPQLEALRLAVIRESIWNDAEKNPGQLIRYRHFLLATYRQQRSAFYLPPATELEAVLQRLIITDERNVRIYKLELAELAWDRGDDATCFQLAQQALDPAAGKLEDSLDPKIAADILARMAESAWRRGQSDTARKLLKMATEAHYSSALLDMTRRKMGVANP
jgi:hypothetical protein